MSTKKKNTPTPTLTDPRYEGLIARVCGILGLMPPADPDTPMHELRFKALSDWCQREQEKNRKKQNAMEMFK